jgi:hypothetical protein
MLLDIIELDCLCSSRSAQMFVLPLKVIKTAYIKTDHVTLIITVTETYGRSFSAYFEFSRS